MVDVLAKVLIAYLLGSVSGSLVLGRFKGVDIRRVGSGNAGATNALRAGGWLFALGVAIIDIGKGYVAAAWVPLITLPLVPGQVAPVTLQALCGAAAILGHCFPVFYGFRGGKGVGTWVGVVLAVSPLLVLAVVGVWITVLVFTGYVSVASMVAGLSLAPAVWWLAPSGSRPGLLAFGIAAALFILFMHRSNLRNLRSGAEHRFDKVRLFHRT